MKTIRTAASGAAIALLGCVLPAQAQDVTGRVAMEAVVSASATSAEHDPFLMFDAVSTFSAGRGWDVVLRPWAKRMPGDDWSFEMYQLQARYTSSTRIPFRFDAGILSSPLGLATLDLKADRNPTIGAPFFFFVPLPPFDGHSDGVTLMSGGYPLGAMVSASGTRWDVRGGITDSTPVRARNVFSASRAPAAAQLVLGGGLTPTQGLRFGAGFARGEYRSNAATRTGVPLPDERATVFNIEGEYSVGYTHVSGEWIVDRFETTIAPAVARGLNLQAVRTLTPRWFAAGRTVRASTPVLIGTSPGRRVASSAEGTLGYRLTPSLTLRAGYQGSNTLYRRTWKHAVAASVVWAQRWW